MRSPEGEVGENKQAYDAHECFLLIIPEVILHTEDKPTTNEA